MADYNFRVVLSCIRVRHQGMGLMYTAIERSKDGVMLIEGVVLTDPSMWNSCRWIG